MNQQVDILDLLQLDLKARPAASRNHLLLTCNAKMTQQIAHTAFESATKQPWHEVLYQNQTAGNGTILDNVLMDPRSAEQLMAVLLTRPDTIVHGMMVRPEMYMQEAHHDKASRQANSSIQELLQAWVVDCHVL